MHRELLFNWYTGSSCTARKCLVLSVLTVAMHVQLYRGVLQEAEDNMNCSMTNVTMTGRDGAISTLEQVFIR